VEEFLGKRNIFKTNITDLFPNLKDWKEAIFPILLIMSSEAPPAPGPEKVSG